MNTSRTTTKMLIALLLGCTAIAAACSFRAAAPSVTLERDATTSAQVPAAGAIAGDAATRSRAQALLGTLPLYFIENRGQEDARVAYYVQGRDTAVYFTGTGVTFALAGPKLPGAVIDRTTAEAEGTPERRLGLPLHRVGVRARGAERERWAVQLEFVGANAVTPLGQAPTPAVVSYFKGGDGASPAGLKTYGSVVYPELWPGIDLVYTGTAGQLKYTFLVKPGADPDRIRLAYRGASGVDLTGSGQLRISTPVGAFSDDRPYAYQEHDGRHDEVPAAFTLATASADGARGYGFKVGPYDRTRTLVLDPSMLVYAGYIGGSGDDEANGIAVDAAGNVYVVGTTSSSVPSFPAKVGPDAIFNGGFSDAFVAKIKADGTDLVYLGYIGGSGEDVGAAIAVDKGGNAYVTGFTDSDQATFPVTVGPDLIHKGRNDAFVAKIKADGTALVYCGYIGGADEDEAFGIAVDAAGSAYVVGSTSSDQMTFPVKVGPDLIHNGGQDAFVAKVKADGTALLYAGYIGGADFDDGSSIAVDAAGNAYVTGTTNSDQTTFPVKVGPDLNYNLGPTDAFVAKVKADGTTLLYAGYIGGAGLDQGFGIAVDAAGNAYVTGSTDSDQTTFPVKVGPDLVFNGGGSDAFVAKVKTDGTTLLFAGYIGGAGFDEGFSVAVDTAGNAYVTGSTPSDQSSFPVKVGPDLSLNGGTDAFVAKVKADGSQFLYAGYIGGAGRDEGFGIAVDAAGNAYVAGITTSDQTTFPATVGPDLIYNGGDDAFVVKISGKPDLATTSVSFVGPAVKPGGPLPGLDTVTNLALGAANASTTRYYLSTDPVKSSDDLLLGGNRTVPGLAPGASSSSDFTLMVPGGIKPGSYFLLACADDGKNVVEVDESNNCAASVTAVQVALPDLVVTGVSNPPQTAAAGSKFLVNDNSVNVAAVSAPASITRFYLSKDSSKGGDILLPPSRAVPALNPNGQAGNLSFGSTLVTIPASTAAGVYHVLACADDLNAVKEAIETNNCRAAFGTVLITR